MNPVYEKAWNGRSTVGPAIKRGSGRCEGAMDIRQKCTRELQGRIESALTQEGVIFMSEGHGP